jgi:short subunit dehydrogenase-like uncharacterized protein
MFAKKSVVVYGAGGYAGRLVCEHLRECSPSFIAASRSAVRNSEVMSKVPDIGTSEDS